MRIVQSNQFNNTKPQAFGAFKVICDGSERAVIELVKKHVPDLIEVPFSVNGKQFIVPQCDLDLQKRLVTEEHMIWFKRFLSENAPIIALRDIINKSREDIIAMVTLSKKKFNEFLSTHQIFKN